MNTKPLIRLTASILVATIALSTTRANAQTIYTTKKALAAVTEQALDQAIKLVAQKDEVALTEMIKKGNVVLLKPGLKVYLEKCLGVACSRVKLRPVGKNFSFYAVRNAISKQ